MTSTEFALKAKSSSSDGNNNEYFQQNSQVESGAVSSRIESEGDLYSQHSEENLDSTSQNLDQSEDFGEDLGKFKSIESSKSLLLDVDPINWAGNKVATEDKDDGENEKDQVAEAKPTRIERNSSAHEMFSELLESMSLSSAASGDTMKMFDNYTSKIKATISSSSGETANTTEEEDDEEGVVHNFCVRWFCCSLLIPGMEEGPSRSRKTRTRRHGKGKSGRSSSGRSGHRSSHKRSEKERQEIEKKRHRLNQKLAKMSPREAHEYKEKMLRKYSAKKKEQSTKSRRKSRDKGINGGGSVSGSGSRSSSRHRSSSRRKKVRSKKSGDSEGKRSRKSSNRRKKAARR